MNFKKYHVSRNLWNAIKYSYTSLSENNAWVYSTSLTGSVYRIPCKPNTTYTLYLAENVDITIWRIREVSTDVVPNASSTSVPTTGTYASSVPASKSATFTTSASAQYILFQTNEAVYDSVLPVIMLIEGNTKIPYEPYSSEVWHDTPHYIHNTSTDTITTLPAVLYLNAATATVGLKGQAVQSGTPTSDSPVMPQGTGERTGNLFDKTTLENGIYLAVNGNKYGDITNGVRAGVKIKALPNTAYTLSAQSSENVSLRIFEWGNGTFIKQTPKYNVSGNISLTVTTDAETTEIAFNIEGVNAQYATSIMLNLGSTTLPYEPFGVKIPISSANTTTPVYLGEVETTRKIKKLVFDGTENWRLYSLSSATNVERFYLVVSKNCISPGSIISSHFPTLTDNSDTEHTRCGGSQINEVYIYISRTIATNVAELKSYLAQQYAAGTPVTVWYVLATPTTGIVNEPLMRIGDYADTLSNISIPVTAGGDTLSVDTTVQPSEVTVNYKGWHPVQNVHEFTGNYTVGTMQTLPISELETHTISELQGGEWS